MIGWNQFIKLTVNDHHRAFGILYAFDIIEMLTQEEGKEATCNLGCSSLHCSVSTNKYQCPRFILSCKQTRWPTSHRSAENNNILAVETETSLVHRLDCVDENCSCALLYHFG